MFFKNCVLNSKVGIAIMSVFVGIAIGAIAAQAQFAPPPPPMNLGSNPDISFSSKDRQVLYETRDLARATYQKLFPRVDDGTSIIIPRRSFD